jgi:hypothetical protein
MIIPRRHTGEGEEPTSVAAPAVQEDGSEDGRRLRLLCKAPGEGREIGGSREQSRAERVAITIRGCVAFGSGQQAQG